MWLPSATWHGLDSFLGLPKSRAPRVKALTHAWQPGQFSLHGVLPEVKSNIELHKGWFNETLPLFFERQGNAAVVVFAHMDADLYESTLLVLNQIFARTVPSVWNRECVAPHNLRRLH